MLIDVENFQLEFHEYQTSYRGSNDCLIAFGTPKIIIFRPFGHYHEPLNWYFTCYTGPNMIDDQRNMWPLKHRWFAGVKSMVLPSRCQKLRFFDILHMVAIFIYFFLAGKNAKLGLKFFLQIINDPNNKAGYTAISCGRVGRGGYAQKPSNTLIFALFDSCPRTDGPTDRRTDRPTDRRTDKASYRVACPQLKTRSITSEIIFG